MAFKKSAIAAMLLGAAALPAGAAEDDGDLVPGTFSANAGFISDYHCRGITQSDHEPAIQGGFDWSHDSGLYAGAWGSNVDFDDGDQAHLELDLYAGYAGEYQGVSYDIGIIYYAYPGAASGLNYDFWEGAISLGYDFGVASASVGLNYSPDYFGGSDDAYYYSADVSVPLPAKITASGHIGYQDIKKNANFGTPDYTDWSVGLSREIEGFEVTIQYIDTDMNSTQCASCDPKVVLGATRSF